MSWKKGEVAVDEAGARRELALLRHFFDDEDDFEDAAKRLVNLLTVDGIERVRKRPGIPTRIHSCLATAVEALGKRVSLVKARLLVRPLGILCRGNFTPTASAPVFFKNYADWLEVCGRVAVAFEDGPSYVSAVAESMQGRGDGRFGCRWKRKSSPPALPRALPPQPSSSSPPPPQPSSSSSPPPPPPSSPQPPSASPERKRKRAEEEEAMPYDGPRTVSWLVREEKVIGETLVEPCKSMCLRTKTVSFKICGPHEKLTADGRREKLTVRLVVMPDDATSRGLKIHNLQRVWLNDRRVGTSKLASYLDALDLTEQCLLGGRENKLALTTTCTCGCKALRVVMNAERAKDVDLDALVSAKVADAKTKEAVEEASRACEVAFAAEGEELSTPSITVPLRCPLGMARLDVPAKGTRCVHLQCFDLVTLAKFLTSSKSKKCPMCSSSISGPDDLKADPLLLYVLRKTKGSVPEATSVKIDRDGGWKPLTSGKESKSAEVVDLT